MQLAQLPDQSAPRELAISHAITTITNLLKVMLFLLQHGVYVVGFRGYKSDAGVPRVVVQVAASPYLSILFRDATWLMQRPDGGLVIHTWFVERWGTQIQWEEACAATH